LGGRAWIFGWGRGAGSAPVCGSRKLPLPLPRLPPTLVCLQPAEQAFKSPGSSKLCPKHHEGAEPINPSYVSPPSPLRWMAVPPDRSMDQMCPTQSPWLWGFWDREGLLSLTHYSQDQPWSTSRVTAGNLALTPHSQRALNEDFWYYPVGNYTLLRKNGELRGSVAVFTSASHLKPHPSPSGCPLIPVIVL
jgi:hypothetical protein